MTQQNEATKTLDVAAMETRIGSLLAVKAGVPTKGKVGKTSVALFACGDDIIATAGRCPHAAGPLHDGDVEGDVLTCPWHGWGFNLRTGICEEDPEMILDTYKVRIDGDDIWVSIE